MAIERSLTEIPMDDGVVPVEELDLDIDLLPEGMDEIETADGGVVIDLAPDGPESVEVEFGSNLAEYMDDSDLRSVSSELRGLYDADKRSRKDWEEVYKKGIDLLGMKVENRTEPWDGACGVTHPLLAEAIVRFQSQAITEIFPAAGPVRTKIVGKVTREKEAQSERVKNFMNYQATEVMTDYRSETEKLLFHLPLAGSAFRKTYWDESMGRASSMFIPSDDVIVSYGASSISTAERVTHRIKLTKNEIRKQQLSGFYADIEIGQPYTEQSDIQDRVDKATGEEKDYATDERRTLLEMHVELDLKGFEDLDEEGEETGLALPYVVTLDLGSSDVYAIRQNWDEEDPTFRRREYFSHYEYIPGLGFYGFGLVHLIGGLAGSATSLIRQLIDAGTLANLPGGLKAKGLKLDGDQTPITPGEWRDVDVPSGSLKENIMPLPYSEPSGVLYQLLGTIVEEGRRFASLTDLNVSDMSAQAPVGTTLALIERSMKVMTAIQARLHASMKSEFKILAGVIKDNAPHPYPYALDGDEEMLASDFDDRVDIIPVSDPNASTMAQRIMQYQAAHQLAQSAPQLYDMARLHRDMLGILGVEEAEKIIPTSEEAAPEDPVTENMNLIMGKPVKAAMWQDHEAHIMAHMSASQDPRLLELLAAAPDQAQKQAASFAHISEHLAYQYRREIEKELGVELPPLDETLPDDVEVQLSRQVAEASTRILESSQQAQAKEKALQESQDPILQARLQELEIQKGEALSKADERLKKLALDEKKAAEKEATERMRITANSEAKENELGVEVVKEIIRSRDKGDALDSLELIEGTKIGVDAAKAAVATNKE